MASFSYSDRKYYSMRQRVNNRSHSINKFDATMKGEPLQKPPPLLLPCKSHPRQMQQRAVRRFNARYDNFNGILKRVVDMRLDSEDATTESEKSESSSVVTRSSRSSGVPYSASSTDDPISPFEDESSASSVTGSDNCSPYEEIPPPMNRYSCSSLPSPPPCIRALNSFRNDLSVQSSTALYSNQPVQMSRRSSSSSSSHYSNSEAVRHRNSRPSSLYSNCEQEYVNTTTPLYSNTPPPESVITDVNDNQTEQQDRLTEEISDAEKRQIEMFYRGLRTDIWVATCLANMYVGTKGTDVDWKFKYIGVPVILLESGDTKSRCKRRIQIVLAERGTAFPLWKDTIDNLSSYRKSGHAFHTMYLSTDHTQTIGFSFDSGEESDRLMQHIEALTADPENINISAPKKKKKVVKIKKHAPLPQKRHISNPCLFEHVTSVAAKDKPTFTSLQTLVDKVFIKKTENIA